MIVISRVLVDIVCQVSPFLSCILIVKGSLTPLAPVTGPLNLNVWVLSRLKVFKNHILLLSSGVFLLELKLSVRSSDVE